MARPKDRPSLLSEQEIADLETVNQIELTCEVHLVTFQSEETGYAVAKVRARNEPGWTTIVGRMPKLVPGENLKLTGVWKDHPKWGRQFEAATCVQTLPANLNGIRRYLSSGMVKGIGPTMADKLITRFGEEILDIIEKTPNKLLEVEGLGRKTLAKITESWGENREARGLMIFLQSHDIPPTFAARILKHYGNDAVRKLKENPYDLAYDIKGIGFKSADNMALKLGFAPDCPQRIEAGIVYGLFTTGDQGHMFFPKEELLTKVSDMLGGIPPEALSDGLDALFFKKRVVIEDLPAQGITDAVFLTHSYRYEKEIASRSYALAEHPAGLSRAEIAVKLPELERKFGLILSQEQREAVTEACANKLYVITGGPGTGKTTITRMIVRLLDEAGIKVKLAAPTGRAAKRMAEATDFQAQTLHRLLAYDAAGSFAHNEESKLKAGALIVDEASMLDAQLFVHLLRALPLACRLILIGDVNQLPSVGAGNVLHDIIESEAIATTRLTRIFRQAEESMIVVNAHRINEGEFPRSSPRQPPESDFFWVEQDDPYKIQSTIIQLVCERIPLVYGLDPLRDVQVLSPMHKGEVGTMQLNAALQARLNPVGAELKRGYQTLRVGDRVLQLKNNYDKDIFNGDLGWITDIDLESQAMLVDFDGKDVELETADLDDLTLAYAVSVHKSQGSEYPAIIMPLTTQHYLLLQRNLIYTGLTRAKRLAVIIGSRRALQIGLANKETRKRFTNLRYRLIDEFSKK